jgi:hypothetical protein
MVKKYLIEEIIEIQQNKILPKCGSASIETSGLFVMSSRTSEMII